MQGLEFTRNQKLALYALIGISAIGLSVVHGRNKLTGRSDEVILRDPGDGGSAQVVTSGSDPMPGSTPAEATGHVIFHVAGCVRSPNVYSLPKGRRIIHAIKAAGGAKPNADLQAINLAAKIEDGSRIYIPSVEDTKAAAQGKPTAARAATAAAVASHIRSTSASGKLRVPGEGVVNINSAGTDELQRLPGVGPATAQKILDYRMQIGRFTSIEQLLDVKGIGPKKLESIRPFVAL